MKLTDTVFRKADACHAQHVEQALALAASGRFGLLPSSKGFELTLSIADNMVEVDSLNCLALTKNGELIDACFDTRYTNPYKTCVPIPDGRVSREYLLAIEYTDKVFLEPCDDYEIEKPFYAFTFFPPNTPVSPRAVPIAHIVNQGGWKLDNEHFVPPCLLVSAHPKMEEQRRRFVEKMEIIDDKCLRAARGTGIRTFWMQARRMAIMADKERDTMTPATLLSLVQQCVGLFACACIVDGVKDQKTLENFNVFAKKHYNFMDTYALIEEGISYCINIDGIIDKMGMQEEKEVKKEKETAYTVEAPAISEDELVKKVRGTKVKIPVINVAQGAIVYYTFDGTEPTITSPKGTTIVFESGFKNNKEKEPQRKVTVKMMAALGGKTSKVCTYVVTLNKDYPNWVGPII